MALNSIFAVIVRLFGVNPPPAVDVPVLSISPSGASSAAQAFQDDVPLPAMPDPVSGPNGAEPAPAAPQNVPSDTNADAWLSLCRPLSQHFENCYLTAYPDPASPLGKALQARGLWYEVLSGMPIPKDPALRALSGAPWTCGWGSTGPDVREGAVWTQATADARHDENLRASAALVNKAARVVLSPQRKAALVSIVNNVGAGRVRGTLGPLDQGRDGIITLDSGQPSTLLKRINIGDFAGAADQFLAWNKAGGVIQPGLVRRRAAERDLFLTGHWSVS
ncbi:lysozyme [Burkholderia anthina]|uniref:lysozyme n=1 Tax=Burkholderia anthina TaxID=179879 RepID=UPI0015888D59|nr:lysozyme [Burkholderia anthina]MBY4866790.1 lysozyme [Burkholderia anthina]